MNAPEPLRGSTFARLEAMRRRRDENHTTATTTAAASASIESKAPESDVGLIWACDVVPEPISWLWEGWIAAGKLHILGGRAGTGKTTLAMSIAATVSRGGILPDGSRCGVPGRVLIWTGEDDPKDTLVPRLAAAGADLGKVAFVSTVRQGDDSRPFDPATDLGRLSGELERIGGARLLIVDSIVSAVAGDSHQNTEVRRSLQPFVDIGTRFGCAILGITHFSKGTSGGNPLERVTGSVAFGALARVVLVASKNEKAADGEPSCIFARAKSNIGKDSGGFGYDLEQVQLEQFPGIESSRVRWGASLEGSAAEILDAAEGGRGGEESGSDVHAWLAALLAFGEVLSTDVKDKAKEEGYSDKRLRTARESLGVHVRREGFGKEMKSWWSFATTTPEPPSTRAHPSPFAPIVPTPGEGHD